MQDTLSWQPGEHVVFSRLGDSVAVLDADRNIYYSLDGIGPFLWDRLAEGLDFSALCRATVSQFDIDEATASRDIAEWIGEMTKSGLISERQSA